MRPRTKIEKEVVKLSKTLCPRVRELKKAMKELQKDGCGKYYHVIAETKGDYQVFRFFLVHIHKRKASTSWETQQLWYGHGREILIGRARTMGWYYDSYLKSSDLELRHNYRNYSYNCANMMPIYSINCVSLHPSWNEEELQYVTDLQSISKRQLLRGMTEYMETLYQQHFDVFWRLCHKLQIGEICRYQNEIKVALRHHFKFVNPVMWLDTMKMAEHFGIETRNPFYCAPKNLEVLHNSLLRRIQKEKKKQEREKLAKYEEEYYERIKPYLDLMLKSANVVIVPLSSVKEVYDEACIMHHCVYECNYWRKADTLLLSAQVNGKHIETIEFNLKSFKVEQARGLQNRSTEYHEEILQLMDSGKNEIKSLKRKAA